MQVQRRTFVQPSVSSRYVLAYRLVYHSCTTLLTSLHSLYLRRRGASSRPENTITFFSPSEYRRGQRKILSTTLLLRPTWKISVIFRLTAARVDSGHSEGVNWRTRRGGKGSEVEWFPRNSLRPSLLDSIWGIIEFSIIVLWIFSLTSIVQVYYRYSRITARERIAFLRVNNFSKKEKGNRFALPSRRETMSKTKGEKRRRWMSN